MPAEFVQRGRAHLERGEHLEAVRVCRLGLLANPGEIEGRIVLGGALLALQRFDEVLAEMRVALDMDPANASAMALRGEALLHKGEATKALELLDHAAAVLPGDTHVAQLAEEARRRASRRSSGGLGTIDIDPDIDGVEIRESRHFGVRALARRDALESAWRAAEPASPGAEAVSDQAIEISSSDLEPLEDEEMPSPFPDIDDRPLVADEPTALFRHRDVAPPAGYGSAPASPFDEDPFDPDRERPLSELGPAVDVDGLDSVDRPVAHAAGRGPTAGIDRLFPDDESGVSKLELIDQPDPVQPGGGADFAQDARLDGLGRSQTDDMRVIRRGLGMGGDRAAGDDGRRRSRRGRGSLMAGRGVGHRSRPLLIYGGMLVVVLIGAVIGGFKIRAHRLGSQISKARAEAAELIQRDRFSTHLKARDILARIVKTRPSSGDEVLLARVQAALAAEYGEGREQAARMVSELGDVRDRDAQVARAYLALSQRDLDRLQELAASLSAGPEDDGLGHYLSGRVHLLAGRLPDAAAAFEIALSRARRPGFAVALARAQHLRGEAGAALEVLTRALQSDSKHPWAVIWEARIRTQHALLPADPSHVIAALGALSGGGSGDQVVSSDQAAWATLALAELQLALGRREEAAASVAVAQKARPAGDWEYSEAVGRVLIGLGDMTAARTEAEMIARNWPGLPAAHVLLAHVALAQDDSVAALSHLAKAGTAAETQPEALMVRARANVDLGKLDVAVSDVDRVLAAKPTWRDALLLKARIDLLRDDAKAALARLEPLAVDSRDPDLVVAYSAALRASGRSDEARAVLGKLLAETKSVAGLVEQAHLERSQGRYDPARAAFQEAVALDPGSVEARLGAALLELDIGNAAAAREGVEALVVDAGYRARVLVEAARVRTLTGDAEGAEELLLKASDVSTSLVWMIARERGRLLLRRLKAIEAASELTRAKDLKPDDIPTRLLLMEAYYQARNRRGSARALAEIAKSFRGRAVWSTASGIDALLGERSTEAVAAFKEARSRLIDGKASARELADVAYWLGRAHEYEGGLTKAEEWLKSAIKLNAMHADAHFWLGQIAFQEEAIGEMISAYERSVEIDPGAHPLAWFYLGQEYVRLKRRAEAKKALEMFLKYWPETSGDLVTEAKTALKGL